MCIRDRTHRHHQAFIKALNHLYTAEPALYERGYTDDGFTWIDADNSKQSIVSFVRQDVYKRQP